MCAHLWFWTLQLLEPQGPQSQTITQTNSLPPNLKYKDSKINFTFCLKPSAKACIPYKKLGRFKRGKVDELSDHTALRYQWHQAGGFTGCRWQDTRGELETPVSSVDIASALQICDHHWDSCSNTVAVLTGSNFISQIICTKCQISDID